MEKTLAPFHMIQSRLSSLADQASWMMRIRRQRGQSLEPKVPIRVETDQFVLKTVDQVEERTQVFRLRYQIFHRELMNKRMPFGFDIDHFDFECDHLAIVHRQSNEVIGTYRLLCSRFNDRFYSEDEFDLSAIQRLPGVKLELGRACVDERFRNGAVLNLLWRGIGEYVRRSGADYLVGCSSVHTMESNDLRQIVEYLRSQGQFAHDRNRGIWCPTTPGFQWNESGSQAEGFAAISTERFRHLFPPLLGSYLRAGARICGGPAVDRAMKCSDFLTLLTIREMNPAFAKRYEVWSEQP